MTGLDSGAVCRPFFEEVFPLSIFSLPVACFLSANTYATKMQLNTNKCYNIVIPELVFNTSGKCKSIIKIQEKIKRIKGGLELAM